MKQPAFVMEQTALYINRDVCFIKRVAGVGVAPLHGSKDLKNRLQAFSGHAEQRMAVNFRRAFANHCEFVALVNQVKGAVIARAAA